jgi:hypothetical protein
MTMNPYICSFCWTGFHVLSSSNTNVTVEHAATNVDFLESPYLGDRIACPSCRKNLLSLSVCWSCGILLFRSDDVVSFGWTFWCRGCYGCLFCHSPLPLPVPTLKSNLRQVLANQDGCEDQPGQLPCSAGLCASEIPTCAKCNVESRVDQAWAGEILRKSSPIAYIDIFDPLRRPSWQKIDELKHIPSFMRASRGNPLFTSDRSVPVIDQIPHQATVSTSPKQLLSSTISSSLKTSDLVATKPSYYPFFQNPRRALVPSIDSSFGRSTTPQPPFTRSHTARSGIPHIVDDASSHLKPPVGSKPRRRRGEYDLPEQLETTLAHARRGQDERGLKGPQTRALPVGLHVARYNPLMNRPCQPASASHRSSLSRGDFDGNRKQRTSREPFSMRERIAKFGGSSSNFSYPEQLRSQMTAYDVLEINKATTPRESLSEANFKRPKLYQTVDDGSQNESKDAVVYRSNSPIQRPQLRIRIR